MKAIYIFFFLFFLNLNAQFRFIYEYKYSTDSIDLSVKKQDLYHLDFWHGESIFYQVAKLEKDKVNTNENLFSEFDYIIQKNNTTGIKQYSNISNFEYEITENPQLNWKIKAQKSKYMDYDVQQAIIEYKGRSWKALFAPSISVFDGPYKFYGLPGLIVKISDRSNTHQFTLKAIQPLPNKTEICKKQRLQISPKQFNKIVVGYRNSSQKELQNIDIVSTEDGISGEEFQKRMRDYYRRKSKRENNFIEKE